MVRGPLRPYTPVDSKVQPGCYYTWWAVSGLVVVTSLSGLRVAEHAFGPRATRVQIGLTIIGFVAFPLAVWALVVSIRRRRDEAAFRAPHHDEQ